ncbi:hypothetical protein ACFX15_026249 [Malus domestica]|uniref:RAF-like serine/threonine-protein kinase PRAF n=1 Tax=Malus domestica TaxID=3750 RepID=UPI00049897A6|nr:uncharacterized protein LOC103402106 [Malus domestica]XP_050132830.1 uncharacterized protein LOC126608856 [Malus sylvestris]
MAGPSPDLTMVTTIKFLCSYGGKILPRYLGGETRVLAVPRSISFSELSSKLTELCGPSVTAVSLRCQLPTEDLDALVSIKSDEDLVNLIEEYDRAASSANMKIRALLSLIPAAEARAMFAILFRKQLTRNDSYLWPRLNPTTQSTLKTILLTCIQQEGAKSISKKLCDTISELASGILPDNGWPELLPFMFQCGVLDIRSVIAVHRRHHSAAHKRIARRHQFHSVFDQLCG